MGDIQAAANAPGIEGLFEFILEIIFGGMVFVFISCGLMCAASCVFDEDIISLSYGLRVAIAIGALVIAAIILFNGL